MTRLPSPLAGVLFDLDGTLVDSEHLHYESTLAVLARYDAHLPFDDFSQYIGWSERPFWESLKARFSLPGTTKELADQRLAVLVQLTRKTRIDPLPGVRETLTWLRSAGVPCAIASSSLREQIAATVETAGLGITTWISGYDDVTRGKPYPDAYLEAARRLGVDPQQCLAVEDSSTGVAAAKAAGAFVVAIPCASHPDPDLSAADLRLESMGELLTLLQAT